MTRIYRILESCDAVALGSLVYFDTGSAQAKLMIDRTTCRMPYVQRPDGSFAVTRRMKRRGVFIAVAGEEQEVRTILATVQGFFNWANITFVDTILCTHGDTEYRQSKTT